MPGSPLHVAHHRLVPLEERCFASVTKNQARRASEYPRGRGRHSGVPDAYRRSHRSRSPRPQLRMTSLRACRDAATESVTQDASLDQKGRRIACAITWGAESVREGERSTAQIARHCGHQRNRLRFRSMRTSTGAERHSGHGTSTSSGLSITVFPWVQKSATCRAAGEQQPGRSRRRRCAFREARPRP